MLETTAANVDATAAKSQDFHGIPEMTQLDYNRGFDNITPLCLILMGNIEHKVIKTFGEYEAFKEKFPDMKDYIDSVLEELKEFGVISLDGDKFVFHSEKQWLYGENPSYRKSVPELGKMIAQRAVKSRSENSHNNFLDFADYFNFPDEPEAMKEAALIVAEARNKIRALGALKSTKNSNRSFRAVFFSGCKFEDQGGL